MPKYQQNAFTLLEMLIALAIFSLVSMTAGSLLYQAVEAQSVSAKLGDRLVDIQRGLGRLSRDLVQYVSREVRDEFGDPIPAILLNPGSLEFTRRGWSNPAQHARSELQRVRFFVDEGALRRAYWDVLDRGPESAPRIQTLITGVSWVAFEAITASQILSGDAFSYADEGDVLPLGVRIQVHMDGYGEFVRIIDLPGEVTEEAGQGPELALGDEVESADGQPRGGN